MSAINGRHQPTSNNPILVLEPVNGTFALKSLELTEQSKVKIGRQTGVTTAPHPSNGYFDSKVLSRVHAEVWSESGKVYIRDLKSSNGTFLNGKRLCQENTESEPFELNQNDNLEFGIDILDENGASVLHEKVSCRIYISRMTYPTPGSSPQDSHAKLKPTSPVDSGVNSVKTNSVTSHGGQSDNMDLILMRLQNELTRSQETHADLGFLRQGLGDLEKALVTNSHNNDTAKKQATSQANGQHFPVNGQHPQDVNGTINYQKLLEDKDQKHAVEVSRLKGNLSGVQKALESQMKSLKVENETLHRNLELSQDALSTASLKMDRVMASINDMIEQHGLELESSEKTHKAALESLESTHREAIDRLVHDADAEQTVLVDRHKSELERSMTELKALQKEETRVLETELVQIKDDIKALRQSQDEHSQIVKEITTEKERVIQEWDETKAQLARALQQIKDLESKSSNGVLSTLSKKSSIETTTSASTSSSSSTSISSSSSVSSSSAAMPATETSKDAKLAHSIYQSESSDHPLESSWSQFVFPMGERNQPFMNQASVWVESTWFYNK
ncbi:hypothetical protein BG011_003629 [Mortierella polycephala]|uniref:FHA domain-containing protein n=1 Tax=Mortierella polycephala TaxID=41804 RepID=A0A9P6Q3X4_9FUNG|nr:hypothetical protein BG011_003629 [Mortierella polycephala]